MQRLFYTALVLYTLHDSVADHMKIVEAVQRHYSSQCVTLLSTVSGLQELRLWRRLSSQGVPTSVLFLPLLDPESLGERCTNSRPLVVLLRADNISQQVLEQLSKRSSLSGPRWLVFLPHTTPQSFLRYVNIPFNCELLVAGPSAVNGEVNLSEVYRIRKDLPLIIESWGSWTPSRGLVGRTVPLTLRRANLRGAPLRAVIKEYLPLLKVYTSEDGRTLYPTGGYFGQVWRALERELNCSTEYMAPPDDAWGARLDNGSWTGIIGVVQRGEADVALSGYTIMAERAQAIDFSQPLLSSSDYAFVQPAGALGIGWRSFLAPLHPYLWLVLAGIIPIAAVFLQLFLNVGQSYGGNQKRYSLLACFHLVFTIFCMQGHYVPARSQPYLIFHWMLYLTAIVISTAYSSSLVAFLSVQRLSLPFTTFEELLQSSYQLGVLAQGSHFTFFQGAKLPPYKAIYHKLIAPAEDDLPKTQMEGLNMICSRPQYSYFATEDVIKPSLKNLPCKVVKVPRTALSAALGLLHPKRSPYHGVIAYKTIASIREANIYQPEWIARWIARYFGNSDYVINNSDSISRWVECLRQKGILQMLQFRTWKQDQELIVKTLRGVTFDAASSLFLLLIMGLGTSVVTLILEMFWVRCRQRQVIRPRRLFIRRRTPLRTEMSWRHQSSSSYQRLPNKDMQSF